MKKAPANAEAEEGLLASCFIDGGSLNVVGKSIESGITPDSFYLPKNASIWQAIATVHASGETVDEFSVATELNRRGQLDLAGGMAELSRIAGRVETASGWMRYQVEVTAKHTARKAQNEANRAIESLSRGDDLGEVLTTAEKAFAELAGQAGGKRDAKVEKLLAQAQSYAFDISKPPERRPPIVTLNGHPVCKKGDLMVFMAPNKTGKSSSLAAMLASTFAVIGADCLGFESGNPDEENVVHCMTEESVEDHWDMVNRSLRRARVSAPPSWFHSYHLRRLDTSSRRQFLFAKARASKPLRLLILDGAADFVEDSNDLAECKHFVDELLALIDELQCAVAVTLHVNPSIKPTERDKGMGHLGSIFERKASSILLLKKEEKQGVGEVITINTKDARKGKAACPPRFIWSEELSMHVRYVGPTDIVSSVQKQPGRSKLFTWDKLATYFIDGMKPVGEWSFADRQTLAQRAGTSESTVRRLAVQYLSEQAQHVQLSELSEPSQIEL